MDDLSGAGRARRALLPSYVLLLLADGPAHGYQLAQALVEHGFGTRPTYIYRTLRALEEDGLLYAGWDASGGGAPARRVYALTPAGKRALDCCAEAVGEIGASLRRYGARYRAVRRRAAR